MKKPYPALCKDCQHAEPERGSGWSLRCHHPTVNARDSWALACGKGNGSACHTEREKGFFSACGMTGRLWESKGHAKMTDQKTQNAECASRLNVGLCDPTDKDMLDWLAERCFSPGDHPDDGILVVVSSEFSPWGEFAIGEEKDALRSAIRRAMVAGT